MTQALWTGWLQNIEQSNDDTKDGPVPEVNTVPSAAVIQFSPVGYYSDGSQHLLINSSDAGASGHWTSSSPLVMYITQTGPASALAPGGLG